MKKICVKKVIKVQTQKESNLQNKRKSEKKVFNKKVFEISPKIS